MRQCRWVELLNDYNCVIKYYPGKANVVADALSRKERVKPLRVRAMRMTVQTSLRDKILQAQQEAVERGNLWKELDCGAERQFKTKPDGVIYYQDRMWIPVVDELKNVILDESHKIKYSVHPGSDKMYQDLREFYWWPGMMKVIAEYVGRCLTCAKVKAEHQKLSGLLEQPEIHLWKWEQIAIDFITKLPRTSSARSRQKSYADRRRKPLEFKVGDRVLFKVSPWKGIVRFGKRGKLTPRCVGPFEIAQRVGPVAYRQRLPDELSGVHDVFHVSNLMKRLTDESLIIPIDEVRVISQLHFIEEPLEILD
ncbi:hypothetical protein R6Q59_006391 [Mikania micrantha]